MELIETYEATDSTGTTVEWVKLERSENEFTWMPKAVYDELQAQQDNPIGSTFEELAPEVVEEIAPEEGAPPVEEEAI